MTRSSHNFRLGLRASVMGYSINIWADTVPSGRWMRHVAKTVASPFLPSSRRFLIADLASVAALRKVIACREISRREFRASPRVLFVMSMLVLAALSALLADTAALEASPEA